MISRQSFDSTFLGLQIQHFSDISPTITFVFEVVLSNVEISCMALILAKYCITHWTLNYTNAAKNQGWRVLLEIVNSKHGGDHCSNDSNMNTIIDEKFRYYLKYKNTLGTFQSIGAYLLICLIILFIINISTALISGLYTFLILIKFEILLVFIFGGYLWYKTPLMMDEFHIYREMRILSIITAFAFVFRLLFISLYYGLSSTSLLMVDSHLLSLYLALFVYLNTRLVIIKNGILSKSEEIASEMMDNQTENIELDDNNDTLLEIIFEDKLLLNLFMNHLQNEFSAENMLAYVEYIQFLSILIDDEWDEYNINTNQLMVDWIHEDNTSISVLNQKSEKNRPPSMTISNPTKKMDFHKKFGFVIENVFYLYSKNVLLFVL